MLERGRLTVGQGDIQVEDRVAVGGTNSAVGEDHRPEGADYDWVVERGEDKRAVNQGDITYRVNKPGRYD